MRRFFTFLLVLVFHISVFSQVNQTELLKTLLELPAPPPVKESDEEAYNEKKDVKVYPPEFYSKNKIPADDAPIEEIMAYWSSRNQGIYYSGVTNKPSEVVADRIFKEVQKDPLTVTKFLKILPVKEEYTSFLKSFYDEEWGKLKQTGDDSDESYDGGYVEEELPSSVKDAVNDANSQPVVDEDSYNVYMKRYALTQIKDWLSLNSDYFSDELVKKAEKIKEGEGGNVQNQASLIALAKYDWSKAEQIVERLFNNKDIPSSQTLAKWAYYVHYLKEEDESNIKKYRRMLQDVVQDRKAEAGVRDMAMDAIFLEADFEGRDDWYLTLLEDETLFNMGSYTGLQTYMNISPPDKWIPKMIELSNSNLPAVRNAAVRNLVSFLGNTDQEIETRILRVLLPWLTDPHWAKDDRGYRNAVIRAYGRVNMPESIGGLIQIIQTEKVTEGYDYGGNYDGNYASNANSNKTAEGDSVYLSESRSAAIEAIATYKDPRAVPVLVELLSEITQIYQRRGIVLAIVASGGYNASQQLGFLEAYARKLSTLEPIDENTESDEDNYYSEEDYYYYQDDDTLTLDESIGGILSESQEPDENLVRFMIERVKVLKKSEPEIAQELNNILQTWKSKVLTVERLNQISTNNAELDIILRILIERDVLREENQSQIYAMRGVGGVASGIAACVLEQPNEVLSAINSNDVNTKLAALGCARLLRIKLPLNAIEQLFSENNPTVAIAAERFLEADDSPEARQMVLARHAGEAKILGAREGFIIDGKRNFGDLPIGELFYTVGNTYYYGGDSVADLDRIQKNLREEVKTNQELQGVYAFLKDDKFGHQILRIYKDKAVYSWYEDEARYREVVVSPDDLKLIYNYVANTKIDELPPILTGCEHGCPTEEFVMFGRNGGRRVYIYAYQLGEQPLYGLRQIFRVLEQGESKLHYWLQDKIAGLEIILEERNVKAQSLWKNGEDFRVLVLDEKRQKEIEKEIAQQQEAARKLIAIDPADDYSAYYQEYSKIAQLYEKIRLERQYEPYQWRSVKDKKFSGATAQPAEDFSIVENRQFPLLENLTTAKSVFKARTAEFELRFGGYNMPGLYKVFRNGSTTKITDNENYDGNLVVSNDGKWALGNQAGENYYFTDTYRINLQTGKEFKIALPKAFSTKPIAFIPGQNKFLVYSEGYEDIKSSLRYIEETKGEDFDVEAAKKKKPEYFLVDVATGKSTLVTGEFEPFKQITFRNLQKTSNADEFWAAIPSEKNKETSVGRYNAKTFKYTEVMKIPEIKVTSMNVWVDETDAKIYFIYEGHLLSLPLKPKTP